MDVRAHLAQQRLGLDPDGQYVKTGQLVSPELIQYLEERYPDSLSAYEVVDSSKEQLAFYAGQVDVVMHLKAAMESSHRLRSEKAMRIVQGVSDV